MVAHSLSVKCGILCPDARTMRFSDRGTTYLSKRFDRAHGRRIHYASAMTMAGKTDMEPAGYIDIISAIETLCVKPTAALDELWRRMIVNICISNVDDHLRNHGFVLNGTDWSLSPCFDVNPEPEIDHMALAIGDVTDRSLSSAMEMAEFFRITDEYAKASIRHICSVIRDNWEAEAIRMGIGHNSRERMRPAFEEAYRAV